MPARKPRAAVRAALKTTKAPRDEFPQLAPLGMKIEKTKGRGNCLFHAVSMQLYGTDARHAVIRAQTVEFMMTNPDSFKPFIVVKAGGGVRGSSRQSSTTTDAVLPASAHDSAWANYLAAMKKPGTYADHLVVTAIAGHFGCTVEVYSHDKVSMNLVAWEGTSPNVELGGKGPGVMRVAHHKHEHFSSVVKIPREEKAATPGPDSDRASPAGGDSPI